MAKSASGAVVSFTIGALLQPLFTIPPLIGTIGWSDQINSGLANVLKITYPNIAQNLQRPLAFLATIGLALHLNRYLTRRAANNWTTDDTYDWKKEIVLVTGGSSGIGLALVKNFASRGIRTVAVDLNSPPAEFPGEATFYKADLTDWQQVTQTSNLIKEDIGEPTVLINNAGFSAPPLLLPTKVHASQEEASKRLAAFERLTSTNFTAHYRLFLHFVPSMASRNHGHIVTVSSAMAFAGMSPSNEYCASKAACANLHDALAVELRYAHGAPKVRTTIYFPGWVRTPLSQSRIDAGLVATGLLLEAEDLAEMIVQQCVSGESGGHVVVPAISGIFASARGWPLWLQNLLKMALLGNLVPRRPDVEGWGSSSVKT